MNDTPANDFFEKVDEYNVYTIGISAPEAPNEKELQNMIRLIAYDICSPKRLRLAAKACEDFGARIEKSVFECDLSESDFALLWSTLLDIIDHDEDSLIAYRVCKACTKEIQSAGVIERPVKRLLYLF